MEIWTKCKKIDAVATSTCSFSSFMLSFLHNSFRELNADPSKAKKPHHRPKNAKDFAINYLRGFYSVIGAAESDSVADSKTSHK
jgi:hypothetical protein